MLLVTAWATVQVHLHPALYLPNSAPEPDLLTWLFDLTLDPSHHYRLCLAIWIIVWAGSALLLHRFCGPANIFGRTLLRPALLWVWTPSSPPLPLLLSETYQIFFIRIWNLSIDLSHRNFSNCVWATKGRYCASKPSFWITTFSFTHCLIHILILAYTFISWIVL